MTEPRFLDWRAAEKRDASSLKHFVCTTPEKAPYSREHHRRLRHPREAEYEVQQTIRGFAVRPERGCHLWVGYDAIGLSAVVKWREVDGPDVIHLDIVGVAMRHRRPGSTTAGSIAREAIEIALSEAEAHAVAKMCDELYAEGEIHHTNSGSLRLMQSFGFAFVAEFPSGAQTWAKRIALIPPGQK